MKASDLPRLPASANPDEILKIYREYGLVIIEGLLSPSEVASMNQDLDTALENHAPGKAGLAWEESLGKNTKRLPLAQNSRAYREGMLENDLIHNLTESILCDDPMEGYHISCAQVIEIGPGQAAQGLHRDQFLWPYWNMIPASGPEACINFFCALTPFTEANGATRVAPKTHLDDDLGSLNPPCLLPVEIKPGDGFLFSGRLIHGGGENKTNEHRRGVTMLITRKGLMPEEAHCLSIPREIAETMSYRGQAMYGFRSNWPIKNGPLGTFWSDNNDEIGRSLGLKSRTMGSVPAGAAH
ncbi:hypothetical protein PENSTE_c016G09299 [Penicillium steckii]|uniref:Fe2OG dioxygenase domain-containing protein n=1 Tax=Penicillium steckii TaxID=303698 RepID=A0A1V6SZE3_9EURO|nr:hypothetical protein PENSTE_c016G09299 [Penicillium steckii]